MIRCSKCQRTEAGCSRAHKTKMNNAVKEDYEVCAFGGRHRKSMRIEANSL